MNLATILSAPEPSKPMLAPLSQANAELTRTLPPLELRLPPPGSTHHRHHSDPSASGRPFSPNAAGTMSSMLRPVFTWGADELGGSPPLPRALSRDRPRENAYHARHPYRVDTRTPSSARSQPHPRRSTSIEHADYHKARGHSPAERYNQAMPSSPVSPDASWPYHQRIPWKQDSATHHPRPAPPRTAGVSPIDAYDYNSTSFGASVNRVRERSRNNTEDERYLLLSHDHWVTKIRPDKVWCRGCEGDIELDDREHQRYYTSGFTKHRKTCAGRILKLEVLCDQLRKEGIDMTYTSPELEDLYWKDEWSSYIKDYYLHARGATQERKEPRWLELNRRAAGLKIPTLEKRNVRVFYDDRVYVKGSYTRGWVPKIEQLQQK